MRRLAGIVSLAAGLVLWLAVTPVAASAGRTTTYHGTFGGSITYDNCVGETFVPGVAGGVWNVAVHGDSATVSVDIFVDGAHHVSFGGSGVPVEAIGPDGFELAAVPTGAGPLTMSLSGVDFTYQIAPYDLYGVTCPPPGSPEGTSGGVTYHGTLDRGR